MTDDPNRAKVLKIAFAVLMIGFLSATYFVLMGNEGDVDCKTGCEHPSQSAPLVCQSTDDCELRGKDEWESCEHKSAPRQPIQEGRPARDQTSKSQEGYSCSCVEKQCAYFKP